MEEPKWIRTGQELEEVVNELIMNNDDIVGVKIADAVEGIAQDRAVTLLVKHFGIDSDLANEIYDEHYNNK